MSRANPRKSNAGKTERRKPEPRRAELLAALTAEFRQLSAATIMFHQAVADRLGMNVTDHKCADILERHGAMTAGELAERTGLTTGAITGVIDRMEKAGFARRAEDPGDRRRVIIEPCRATMQRVIGPLFEGMGRAAAELCAGYTTEELSVIRDFTVRAHQMAIAEAHKLRDAAGPGPHKAGAGMRRKSPPPVQGE
jgi:DNA-binding MarR family transcriptional regulator